MASLRYITHPEVRVDPRAPVDELRLSDVGRRRAERLCSHGWVADTGRIVSSPERKAFSTAEIVATHLGLTVEVRPNTHENDRSATGFLPPDEFETVADQFFAAPTVSTRGWERAVDAQRRIVDALADLVSDDPATDVAVFGHGGVGTLWYCHLAGIPIDRQHDQPGQGHYFTIALPDCRIVHPWRAIDPPSPTEE